jgi:streptogrisin C
MITRTKMCLIALAVIGSVVSSSTGAVAEDDLEPPPSAETGRIDPAAEYMQQAYGISRTEAERRLQLQVPLASLDEELKTTDGQAFGGLWIDQADGGRVVLATTGDGGALLEKVRARGFADAEERQVKYSLERLTRVQRALERAVGADGQVSASTSGGTV